MIKVAVFGGSGYSGRELVRILLRHTGIHIQHIFTQSMPQKAYADLYPEFRNRFDLHMESFCPGRTADFDLAFLALPHGASMELAPVLLDAGHKVIDLSGDFRFPDPLAYQQGYSRTHTAPQYLQRFVYGLPEYHRETISGAQAVANPGCYPTAALLSLIPLLSLPGMMPPQLTVNALSGRSGAGRQDGLAHSFCESANSVRAYRIGSHAHVPEIEHILETLGPQKPPPITFIPHLLPLERGLYTSAAVPNTLKLSTDELLAHYRRSLGNSRFVRLGTAPPDIAHVVGTPFCDIGISEDKRAGTIVICAAIDNLVRGAAGQAVQNMNLMLGYEEQEGLI